MRDCEDSLRIHTGIAGRGSTFILYSKMAGSIFKKSFIDFLIFLYYFISIFILVFIN